MGLLLLFDISGGELLVIMLVVLIFFGSKGIPDIARTMGRTMRQIRDASADVQREIQKGAQDVKQGFDQQRRTFSPEEEIPRPTPPGRTPPKEEGDAESGA